MIKLPNHLWSLFCLVCGLCCGAAPVSGLGASPGDDMALESAIDEGSSIRVVTTGAEFVFHKDTHRIELFQRIPARRLLGSISGLPLEGIKSVIGPSEREGEIGGATGRMRFSVSADSLLKIRLSDPANVTVEGAYEPQYQQHAGHDFFLPDERGGLGFYLVSGEVSEEQPTNWKPGWLLRYQASQPGELWVSVFPPKPFDWAQSHQTIIHYCNSERPYPSDADLRAMQPHGSVLSLHCHIWQGTAGSQYGVLRDNCWTDKRFEPKSGDEFRRAVRAAQAIGMRVVAYMSPFYAASPTPEGIDEFVNKVALRMKEYDLDGVYFDGVCPTVGTAYEFVTRTRQAIGNDGLLYMHLTSAPDMICPFIDCHADYILRGEHLGLNRAYARWHVSGYNLSNSIGFFCGSKSHVSQDLIDLLLSVHARIAVFWGNRKDEAAWGPHRYIPTEPEQQLLLREYYPRLKKDRMNRGQI